MQAKFYITIILLILLFSAEPTAVYKGCDLLNHFTFHFYHANIFHLSANVLCLWTVRKHHWVISYIIATIFSFLITSPTVGLSAILFATVGINYGIKADYKNAVISALVCTIYGLLPGISLLFHLLSLAGGFIYGYCYETVRLYRNI